MSLPDATAAAALDADHIKPVWFVYLDFVGEPVRANSSGRDITISGSGDDELDGEYLGIDSSLVAMSPIKLAPGGGDTRWIRLSGIRGIDDETRTLLADPANWQDRLVRRWRLIRNTAGLPQGGLQPVDTGYMMSLTHFGSASSATIELTYETYLAALKGASGRTWLDLSVFDEEDLSPRAALAIANGNSSSPLTGGASVPGPRSPGIPGKSWLIERAI